MKVLFKKGQKELQAIKDVKKLRLNISGGNCILSLIFITLVLYLRNIDKNEDLQPWMNGATIFKSYKDYIIVHKIEGKVSQ